MRGRLHGHLELRGRNRFSGVVRILKDLDIPLQGRDVLIVEDIIDSGSTLSYLMRNLRRATLPPWRSARYWTKPGRREIEVPVKYVGFEIPNRFVIGYGLDYAERYRNLRYVGVLNEALTLLVVDAHLERGLKSLVRNRR